jgi:hypothetical protein
MDTIRRGAELEMRYASQSRGADPDEWRLVTVQSDPAFHPRFRLGLSFGVTQNGIDKRFYLSRVLECRPPAPPSSRGEPSDSDAEDSSSEEESPPGLDARKRRRLMRAITAAIDDALA